MYCVKHFPLSLPLSPRHYPSVHGKEEVLALAMATTDSMADKRPAPIDLSRHYSASTKARHASSIKKFYKYFQIPGIANLAGGLPNYNYFPFDTLEATAALPQRWTPTPNDPVDPPSGQLAETSIGKQKRTQKHKQAQNVSSDVTTSSRIVVPMSSENQDVLRKIDLKTALQYGQAQGYPPLYSFLRQFTTENLHPNVPYKDGPEIVLTCGNTDGFAKTLEALTNVWSEEKSPVGEKEGLLVEEFAYMNAIQAARPRGMNIVPVAIDDEGMCAQGPGGLLDVLENWDTNRGKRPHLIYTVTIGQNPTSGVLSLTRRRAIYALCVKYDVIIVEDDPYWYLQYPSATALSVKHRGHPVSQDSARPGDPYWSNYAPTFGGNKWHPPLIANKEDWKSSGYDFLDSLVPSYLSVDYQGRVVRLDTFSKTVAPGCRLGWITTQPALAERILRITETSTQQPSGFVQSLIAELIMGPHNKHGRGGGGKDGQGWQMDGWVRWLEGLRGNYERRMQTMSTILEEGKSIVKAGRFTKSRSESKSKSALEGPSEEEEEEWSIIEKVQVFDFVWPMGGMFLWLKVNYEAHPLWHQYADKPGKLAEALWIHLTTEQYLILLAPGSIFAASEEVDRDQAWKYFRVCFAAVDEPEVEKSSRRLVAGVHDFWAKKNLDDIEQLVARGCRDERLVDMRGFC